MENKLPEDFLHRMKILLADEYQTFENEIKSGKSTKALFINTQKCDIDTILSTLDGQFSKIDFADNGFYFDNTSVGSSPLHHAGAYYIQDPSAMSTLCAIDLKPGSKILDLCSSPGGKTLAAAVRNGKDGIVVSNEYNVTRCKTLVGNIERFGLKNHIVLNTDAAESSVIPDMYSCVFDLVIADVPCSGEGMFRKYPKEAIGDWSTDNVSMCAQRQQKILSNAAKVVADKGYLLYSTCTFSLEENEMNIDLFLQKHKEFSLIPVSEKVQKATSDGIFFDGCKTQNISLTRRFYPHKSKGEGQFIALMQKNSPADVSRMGYKSALMPLSRDEQKVIELFVRDNLEDFPTDRVFKYNNNNIVCVESDFPVPQKHVFSCGVKLGEIAKGRLIPHHQFFKVYSDKFKNKIHLHLGDDKVKAYLRGEVFEYDIQNGWCAVLVEGITLGGGKAVDGQIKNHYPKGLRTN